MGINFNKGKEENLPKNRLGKKDLKEIAKKTHFTVEEVQQLYDHFVNISSTREDDGFVDKEEFKIALELKESLFVNRMFALFDSDNDGNISFSEFVCGLSIFSEKGTVDEKVVFSFKIYDFDNDGFISYEELYRLLEASLSDLNLGIPEKQLSSLIQATFDEADTNADGKISFDEYKFLVSKHPSMLSNMTISILGKTKKKEN